MPAAAADVALGVRGWDVSGTIATAGAAVECVAPATTEVSVSAHAQRLACRVSFNMDVRMPAGLLQHCVRARVCEGT